MADFSVKPVLAGGRVLLRPSVAADTAALGGILREPEVLRLTGSVHADGAEFAGADPAAAERFRQWRNVQPDRLDLAVVDRGSDRCVGEVVLNQYDPGNRSCNFRILVGAAGQGRGLGTEATRLMVGYGLDTLGLHRISLEVSTSTRAPGTSTRRSASSPRACCASRCATTAAGSTRP